MSDTYFNPLNGHDFVVSRLEAPSYLKEFLNYILAIENVTKRTAYNYYMSLRTFLRWVVARENSETSLQDVEIVDVPFSVIEEITPQDLYAFLSFCASTLGNSAASRSSKLSAIKKFFHYYEKIAPRLSTDPARDIKMPKLGKPLPKYLDKERSLDLLDSVKSSRAPERDHCMTLLFLTCGMRLSELTGINWDDLRNDSLILHGKGRKERIVYLTDDCLKAIAAYKEERSHCTRDDDKKAMFISYHTGKRIGNRSVENIISAGTQRIGMGKGYSVHKLRHSAASMYYQQGVDILTIKEILGHENLQTTQVYAHLASNQVKDAMVHSPLTEKCK